MAYITKNDASYGGLGRAWGLGTVAAPTTAGATAIVAGSNVIAAPPEASPAAG
jgi:hypothetical protein